MAEKILIADDEQDIVSMLDSYFTRRGYKVLRAYSGAEAVRLAERAPDVILLDVGLPDMDGLEVCRRIRAYVSCPIVFLTARVEDADKIRGFAAGGGDYGVKPFSLLPVGAPGAAPPLPVSPPGGGGAADRPRASAAGADDYVVKPFSIDELGARVAAHLRREKRHAAAAELRFDGDLVINYSDRTASLAGRDVGLARREFDILEFLSQNPGLVFDKERIYEGVWGIDGEGDSTVVVEHIRRIRVKLAAAGAQRTYIETVWGVGYKWAK